MTRQTMSATNNIVPCWHLQEICGFNNPGCIPGSGVGRFRRCEGAVPTEKRSALTRNNVWRWRHYDPAKSTTPLYNVTQIVFMWFVGCRKPNILAQGRFIRVFTLLLPDSHSQQIWHIYLRCWWISLPAADVQYLWYQLSHFDVLRITSGALGTEIQWQSRNLTLSLCSTDFIILCNLIFHDVYFWKWKGHIKSHPNRYS